MARKKAPPAPPLAVPSRERVLQHLRVCDFSRAYACARELHAIAPSDDTLALVKQTLIAVATELAERDQISEFNRTMADADRLDETDAAWVAECACLLARGGRLADALMRADDATRPRVLAHAADRALRLQSKDFLPDELHAGFDAVVAAFRQYETGKDEDARASLEPIGLRSPFLEWKLLLRGLLAYAANDDARAVENFARLDSARFPIRLAAPYRSAVDPAWMATLPASVAAEHQKHYGRLNASPIAERLRDIARHLGRDKPLQPVFRTVETLVLNLKVQQPQLVSRLANCIYQAILQQGQPEDMARYRKIFGNPPDDPSFFKLQAMIGEQGGNLEMVHNFWKKYDDWLASNPPGWSAAVLARARASVWLRLGDNAERAIEEDLALDEHPMFEMLGPPLRNKQAKPLDPPALECFRKAVEYAPDWAEATRDLFKALDAAKKPDEAEAVARRFLALQPDSLLALTAVGELMQEQGRAAEAADFFLRAVALNPLDKSIRQRTAFSLQAKARRALLDGNAEEIEAIYERHRTILDEEAPAAIAAVRSVSAQKLKQFDLGASLRERALRVKGQRLAAAYQIAVDSQLAKLKPAEKKIADAHYSSELAKQIPTPEEVVRLIACYESYSLENLAYRGQKTHEKKILDQSLRTLLTDASERDFESLADSLCLRKAWKHLKKFSEACLVRFFSNPHFPLMRSEAGYATSEHSYSVEQRLRRAKQLAESSREPRHRELIARIDELLAEVAMPFDLFGSFFGRRG